MKFLVLLYTITTFIEQSIAVKSPDYTESYFAGVASASSWAGCIKRFYILLFLIPGIVLYYVPESRHYARKACHIMIDLVANGLKAALSGSYGNETCLDVARTSYYSERFLHVPDIQNSVIAQKDHLNPSHSRRRHRIKQDSKIEEDKSSRGQDRRKHRHSERSRYSRDEKNRNAQHNHSQSTPKTILKELEIRPSPLPPLHFHTERANEGFYYPEVRNDDSGAKYSTSFVISGVKTTSNILPAESNCKRGSIADADEEKFSKTVFKHRSRPSKRTRPEDAIHPENDGPTRDCENFLLTEVKDSQQSYDIESKIGFITTNLDYPERECDASNHKDQPHHEDSATTVEERYEADEGPNFKRASEQNEDTDDYEEDEGRLTVPTVNGEIVTGFPPAEGNRTNRVKEASLAMRKVNFQKKDKEKGRQQKIAEDEDDCAASTNNEAVLNQLGDQIAKLEKTIKMMKPEMNRKERGHRNRDDYAVQNIETVLKDMKHSFSKVDEQMKRRSKERVKEQTKRPCQTPEAHFIGDKIINQKDTESLTSIVDDDTLKAGSSWSSIPARNEESSVEEVPEGDSSTSQLDLTILRSETLLDDEDELAPIVTNRVKPYLIRTFDWLFTGCPGGCSEKRYSVGKDGASKTAAE